MHLSSTGRLLAQCRFLCLVLLATGFAAAEAQGHPGWARKYKMSCFACHAPVPKLNDFGRRFRVNGFQLPGTLEATVLWEQKSIPIAAMVHEMFVRKTVTNNMAMDTGGGIPAGESLRLNSFNNLNLELFSGGIASKNISYFALWEFETHNELEDGKFHTETGVEFEQAFVMYNNILDSGFGHLNARIGLFELDLPFSQIRSLSAHANKYLIYDVAPVDHGFKLGAPQLGISAKGRWEDFEYEAAIVNGTNGNFDTNTEKDVYLRAAYTFYDPVPGVTDLRIGALGYLGMDNLASNVAEDSSGFTRFGLDVSVGLSSGVNVFGQWLLGRNEDNDGGTVGEQEFEYSGGFVGVDTKIVAEKLFAFSRYDWVNIDNQVNDLAKFTAGLRYHFNPSTFMQLEWFRQNNMIGYPGDVGTSMNVDSDTFMLMVAVAF